MFDCTDQVRSYVEGQEIERAISLNVESIVDGTMAEAPECMEEALMIVDDMIDHACLNGSARDEFSGHCLYDASDRSRSTGFFP